MKKNVAWIASVGLNVVFAVGLPILLISNDIIPIPGVTVSAAKQAPAGEGRRIEQALRAAGLSATESKRLVEALILERETRAGAYEYWRSPLVRDSAEQIEALERSSRVRTALGREFGPKAQEDPAFARSFRPYDREFPTFSSDKQVQLQQHTLERLKAQLDPMSAQGLMPVSRTPTSTDAFEQVLDPRERFEYVVRESALAKALSTTPFEFSEKEFRSVFGALATARPDIVMSATTASINEALSDETVRKSLTESIGKERYEGLRRSRDPSYGLLRRVAEVRGISRETLDKAYDVLASAKPAPDPATGKPPAELLSLLGPDVAADMHRAFTYSRQSPRPGGALSQAAPGIPGRLLRVAPAAAGSPVNRPIQ